MKASYRWLRELLPALSASPQEVATRLTNTGLEVEWVSEYGAGTEQCLVVRVASIRPHPTKSGLRLVTVDRGDGKQQEVVCGAPNVPDPGGLVVLAPLGAHLPAKNLTIAPRAIAGVTSEGMLCSESELGLSEESEGIIILPPGTAEPGTKLADAVPNARDTVFEINLTPNRPDALGHIGIARQLAAVLGQPFAWPDTGKPVKAADVDAKDLALVTVEDSERCSHYGGAGAIDVTIGPSPLWLKFRLQALGVRSISNVVDITNLVMLEYGHPMHAFDLDRVRPDANGKKHITVRRAKDGEVIKTLDGVDRKLVGDDLLICDGQGPVALAGVMGGADSEIQPDTKRVFYEAATFDARGVRRTARRHAMHTESSHRFERGVDAGDVARVLDRAVALTTTLAGAAAARGRTHVQGKHVGGEPAPIAKREVRFRAQRVRELTGVDVPVAEAVGILERLGFEVGKPDADGVMKVLVPTHRVDVSREADLVEDVIQVHGMEAVPTELPAIRASRDVGGREELARRTKEICATLGLSEALTFSFTSARVLEALGAPAPAVKLDNPMAEHQNVLRTSLLVGLLDAVANARRRGERDVREFTVGPVFLTPKESDPLPDERLRVAFALAGDRPAWLERAKPLDVWDAKGYAMEIARRVSGKAVEIVPAPGAAAPAHLHPRGAAFVHVNGERVGAFGPLHPDVVDALDLGGDVLVFEMELDPFA
ncbi:MAG: Phenylalanyl-tRNA synthetase beta chain, partial [Labilithrix sp.]|nr:Phenylalanyl-tRNA synthetase beta chain [Labilithrix sp.]